MDWIPKPPNKTPRKYTHFEKTDSRQMNGNISQVSSQILIQSKPYFFGCFIMLTTQETPQGYPYLDSCQVPQTSRRICLWSAKVFFTPKKLNSSRKKITLFFSKEKNPGCLGRIGDYTTRLCGDYYDGGHFKRKGKRLPSTSFQGTC